MESPSSSKPSGIPRVSRLPVPRAGLRHSPSRESFQQSQQLSKIPQNPRLRNAPSRDQLTSTYSSRIAAPLQSRASSQQLRKPTSVTTSKNGPTYRAGSGIAAGVGGKQSNSNAQESTFGFEVHDDHTRQPASTVAETTVGLETGIEAFEQTPRKSRPSLSERAMESLQQIPSSPAIRRRTSNFFNPESPMRPASSGNYSSRPGSSHDSTAMRPPSRSFGSRPGSRAGESLSNPDFRASTSSTNLATKKPSLSNLRAPSKSNIIRPGSQTVAARPLKPRASLNGLFRKPSVPAFNAPSEVVSEDPPKELDVTTKNVASLPDVLPKRTMASPGSVAKKIPKALNSASRNASVPSKATRNSTSDLNDPSESSETPRKSSSALRDQIAKAKAAKRAMNNNDEAPVIPEDSFDFGLGNDPFNQKVTETGSKGLLKKRIQAARNDGRLNISALGLKQIPDEILAMYDLDPSANDGSWAESVDLTRFVAAGNEIETISDAVFPDIDPRESLDDDARGNQFGGLEMLDLHGNLLLNLPLGLRRLELLTTLNLSNNQLENGSLEVISKIPSLRDLKLGNNKLSGSLDASITNLVHLETLDIQRNALTSLPDGLQELVRLRVLNLTENRLTSLSFGAIKQLPLTELLLAKNKLTGTLIGSDVELLPQLQVLDITANSITGLTLSDGLSLPSLHQLSVSSNRLTALPDLSSWTSLRTLTAEDNNIDSIPEGFTTSTTLRNVDFSGNNIRILDDQIGNMESLDIFRISGNPLREKKFSAMTTEDLKRALRARLPAIEPEIIDKDTDHDGSFYSASASPVSPSGSHSSDWTVLAGGILDRSGKKAHSLNPVTAAQIAGTHQVKVLELHHNIYKEIPSSIGLFAASLVSLNLAHNELNSDTFLNDELVLPVLKELNLSSNTFNSLQPLIARLQAPNLVKLDISFNRLTSLPPLKPHFPNLVTLLASNNTIRELSPEAVKGLVTLDCSSNDINSLNARIGLLGGPGGLQRLDVSGNRFRVPKYTVLEKGTEATLAWLKDRIPVGDGSSVETVE